jgi:hypothetical protein
MTVLATLMIGLPINFSSNMPIHNLTLILSDDLQDVVVIGKPHFDLVQANKVQQPQIFVMIGPNTTGGWHNGTIAAKADGKILKDQLELNIQVPKLIKSLQSMQTGYDGGGIYRIVVPSYSPYFNDTVNIYTWFDLGNGTAFPHPYGTAYDAFFNASALPLIALSTDKENYSSGDEIRIMGKLLDYKAHEANDGVKFGLSVYRMQPFVSVYETFVTIDNNGEFLVKVPARNQLGESGRFNVFFSYADAYFTVESADSYHPRLLMNEFQVTPLSASGNATLKIEASSTIMDFAFDDAKKEISFIVTGDGQGSASIIHVGTLLKGPYVVRLNEEIVSDFETDNSTSPTKIIIKDIDGIHKISVIGTEVVPEFGQFHATALVVVAALAAIACATIRPDRLSFWDH